MADQSEIARHSHPLKRYIICCTSIPPDARVALAKKAEEMGAKHVLDLTSEVTHLVCGDSCTPKYNYVAKMRPDVKVMKEDWVDAMYKPWLSGEDINARDFEKEYRYPTLCGLRISVTGIVDVAERKRIEDICTEQAATYHSDLSKHVTHLIAAAPTGKKYEFARANNIHTIAPQWLWDSLERGMALDESCYNPLLPPEKIGAGARPAAPLAPAEVADVHGKRKIRRKAEEKLGSSSQNIWGDIMGQATNVKPKKQNEWEDLGSAQSSHTLIAQKSSGVDQGVQKQDKSKDNSSLPPKTGMFRDAIFHVHGFNDEQEETICSFLTSHDGTTTSSLQELRKLAGSSSRLFLVVPHQMKKRDCPAVSDIFKINTVTEWWIEACLHKKRFVEPSEGFTNFPFENFPLEGFKGMEICVTMFTGVELMHLTKLIPLLGAKFHDILSKKRALLISNTPPKGEKYRFAIENDIPVVTAGWLYACLKQSKRVPYDEFLLKGRKKTQWAATSSAVDSEKKKRMKPEANEGGSSKKLKVIKHLEDKPSDIKLRKLTLGNRFKMEKRETETVETANAAGEGEHVTPQSRITSAMVEGVVEGKIGQVETANAEAIVGGSERKGILDGCVISVSRQLKTRSKELGSIAQSLGAIVYETFSVNDMVPITHLIHSSKNLHDSTKDYILAKSIDGCSIVSPDWLYKCHESGRKVDEKMYPPMVMPCEGLETDFGRDGSSKMEDVKAKLEEAPVLSPDPNLLEDGVDVQMSHPFCQPSHGKNDSQAPIREPTPPTSAPVPTLPLPKPREEPTPVRQIVTRRQTRHNTALPEASGKASSLKGGIGQILGKIGKESLTTAMDKRKRRRGPLQGKAIYTGFSRASSTVSSRDGSAPPSQPPHGRESNTLEPKRTDDLDSLSLTQDNRFENEPPMPSQAIRYADPEAEKERKNIRAKLGGDVDLDTPRMTRRTRAIGAAVDLDGIGSRTRGTRKAG